MEVEFLIPEQGRGINHSITVKALGVRALPLRFLSLAFDRSMVVFYRGYNIRVPEPEAFVLTKLLVIPRREDKAKIMKDAYTARVLGEFLLNRSDRRMCMQDLFNGLPKGWQIKIRQTSQEHFPILLDVISGR